MKQPNNGMFYDQWEFLQAGDVEVGTIKAEVLAANLMGEEFEEFRKEPLYNAGHAAVLGVNTIKEALDLMYVTAQYLNVTIGPEAATKCWDALHANNMSKCIGGKLVKRADGKVMKPDGFKKLDLSVLSQK